MLNTTKEHQMSTEDMIQDELSQLKADGIPYEYRAAGCKKYALVKINNDKTLMVCPYRKSVIYRQKTYKYKRLKNWLKTNKLELTHE